MFTPYNLHKGGREMDARHAPACSPSLHENASPSGRIQRAPGPTPRKGESMSEFTVKCGPLGDYRGVAKPKLDVSFLQTEEEKKKYEPIMKHFQENGLPTDGATTISGI